VLDVEDWAEIRRLSVHASRADKLFTRLRAARLDNTLHIEMRRLARVDLLILDDFALRPLDATETNDFYELIVERTPQSLDHRDLKPRARRVAHDDERRPPPSPNPPSTDSPPTHTPSSSKDPPTSNEINPNGTPVLTPTARPTMLTNTSKWSHALGNEVVPSRWQATSGKLVNFQLARADQ
jgi:IstB-like ATP binding protein